MGVQYSAFKDIDINDFDAVVVGSGFAGSVTARQLAERAGMRVLIIEKRPHIGGNMYDEKDEAGILVHRYGPHIFHTNSQRAFNYLRRFSGWLGYQHHVLADWYGTYLHQRPARAGRPGAGGNRRLRVQERVPLLHPEAVGAHAGGGRSVGDRPRARVHLAR